MTRPESVSEAPLSVGSARTLPRLAEDGLLAGLVGAVVVALWFLILDFARAAPLLTPTLLGSVLFLAADPAEVDAVNWTMVFAYTGVHGFLFLIAGCALAWLVAQVERNPQLGLLLVLLFLLFEAVLFGLELTVVPALVGALGAASVAVANLFAATAMFAFLLARRPKAWARLRDSWEDGED